MPRCYAPVTGGLMRCKNAADHSASLMSVLKEPQPAGMSLHHKRVTSAALVCCVLVQLETFGKLRWKR